MRLNYEINGLPVILAVLLAVVAMTLQARADAAPQDIADIGPRITGTYTGGLSQ